MATFKTTKLERIEFEPPKIKLDKLPLVIDDWTLAFRLGFTGRALWFILNNRDKQYKVFKIKKASGGLRTVHNPSPIMRLITKQVRSRILLPLCEQLGPHVGAYQVGKSTRDTAKQHLFSCEVCDKSDQPHTCQTTLEPSGKGYQLIRTGTTTCPACQPVPKHDCTRRGVKIHMDLKDFFPSTRRSFIRKYFHEVVGYNHYVSGLLAQLLTVTLENPKTKKKYSGVPQGSLASGDICNLVADWKLDGPLLKALPGWRYSRYADDLYFSHPENLSREEVDKVIATITQVVVDAGYRVNRRKLHVQRPNRRQKILGIVLNQKVNIPRESYRKFRSLLHNCVKDGFQAQVKRAKKESVGQLHSWIAGKIAYFAMVAPERANKLRLIYSHARTLHEASETFEVNNEPDMLAVSDEEVST